MSQNIIHHSIKNEIKSTLSLSIPLVASQLIYACSGFIGTALVARLGEDALAASVLVSMIWMTLSVLFFGMLNSISVLVSHQYGAKNNQAITEIMGQSFLLGMIVSILIILIFWNMPFFLRTITQSPTILKLAIDYTNALLWTVPGLVILIIYEQFFAGINRPKLVLRISLLVVPIEITLIYFLIFGKFGLPVCGVAGIGYGFATTYTCTAVILTIYLLKSKSFERFRIFSELKSVHLVWFKELIRIGLPIGFMHVVEVGAFTVMTFWIARFGTTFLAAHQIVIQYLNFVITLAFAMSQAVTVRIGHSVGKQDLLGIHYAVYAGMILNLICILLVALAFNIFPEFFLRLDLDIHASSNAQLIRDSSTLLGICGILLLFDSSRIVGFGALRGLKDTKFSMVASLIGFGLIGLSFGYLFGFVYQLNTNGIWWGMVIGIASGAFIVFARLLSLLRRIDLRKLMAVREGT